jgi:hypothetical protein
MRYLFGFLCVCALGLVPLAGCSETAGNGGGGGEGGQGGGAVACVDNVCPCTEEGIRAAIGEGGGPFTFDCDGPTTVETDAEIVIDNDVVLYGEGELTVDGKLRSVVFSVGAGVEAELRGFTVIRGGAAASSTAAR